MIDPRSASNVATLNPQVRAVASRFLDRLNAKLPPGSAARIISGTRTYAEQNALYEQGRTRPGPRVTNARGGYSNHNFGIAWDVGLFQNGKYLEESKLYKLVGEVAAEMGLEWGGNWKSFPDEPHVEMHPGWAKKMSESEMIANLRNRNDSGIDVFA